jgi:hypothetical protein
MTHETCAMLGEGIQMDLVLGMGPQVLGMLPFHEG